MNILFAKLVFYALNLILLSSLHHDDNGTFLCQGENEYGSEVAILENLVLDKPGVRIDHVRAVAKDYLNWTVTEWNSPITDFFLSVRPVSGI